MSIDSNYGNVGYSGSSDPWSNQGLTSSGQSGLYGNGYYQAYEQQLLIYIQNLKTQLGYLQAGTPDYEMASQYLTTALGYLQQVDPAMASDPSLASWDPLSGSYSSPYSSTNPLDPEAAAGISTPAPVNDFPVSYQDSTHIVTDEGDGTAITLSQSDPENRVIDVYQMDNTLTIPSNAASVKAELQPDDAVPDASMVVVTYTVNGVTRTVKYHNVKRDDFNLHIMAPDVSQITLDASLTSSEFAKKVSAHALGEVEDMQGTPPDETDSETRTWNKNDAVDYYVTEGTEVDEIYADTVNITLDDRSQMAQVTKTGEHEYTIEIYDETGTELIRTVHLHQVTGDGSINFNHLAAENLQYADVTDGSTAEFKAWDDPSCKSDPFIAVNGQEGGALAGPLHPDFQEDNIPSQINSDGDTATYDQEEDVSIHAYSGDGVTTHEIYAGGAIDIYPESQKDQAAVSYDKDSGMLIIGIGDETFKVDASMADKINLHMDTSTITYGDIPSNIAEKILDSNGNDAATVQQAAELSKISLFKSYINDGTYTEEEILEMMNEHHLSPEDFDKNKLPIPPSDKMIAFLRDLDSKLDGHLKNTDLLETSDPSNSQSIWDARNRLIHDLEKLGYKATALDIDVDNPLRKLLTHSQSGGKIVINGHIYNIFDQNGKVDFKKWEFDTSRPHRLINPETGSPILSWCGEPIWVWWDSTHGKWQSLTDILAEAEEVGLVPEDYVEDIMEEEVEDPSGDFDWPELWSASGSGKYDPNDPDSWQGDGK